MQGLVVRIQALASAPHSQRIEYMHFWNIFPLQLLMSCDS
jgi:hypothetical protein